MDSHSPRFWPFRRLESRRRHFAVPARFPARLAITRPLGPNNRRRWTERPTDDPSPNRIAAAAARCVSELVRQGSALVAASFVLDMALTPVG